jgi:hypothetical protein
MRIINEDCKSVRIDQMEDGDIAVVRDAGETSIEIGKLVQRYKANLIFIGERSGKCFTDYFIGRTTVKVEILKPGTQISVII